MSSIWSKDGLHRELGAVSLNPAFQSKTGLYKCGTCLEVCAEPNALRTARKQRDRLKEWLQAAVDWNDEYKRLNHLVGDPGWVSGAKEVLAEAMIPLVQP